MGLCKTCVHRTSCTFTDRLKHPVLRCLEHRRAGPGRYAHGVEGMRAHGVSRSRTDAGRIARTARGDTVDLRETEP